MSLLRKSLGVLLSLSALGAGILAFNAQRTDFTTLDGADYQWQNLRGQWLVINYFAPWCAPCLREIPQLNQFHRQNQQRVKLFGISFDGESEQQLAAMQQQYNIQFPLIAKLKSQMPMSRPKSLPATYLIAPDGTVAKHLLGEQSAASLEEAIGYLERL